MSSPAFAVGESAATGEAPDACSDAPSSTISAGDLPANVLTSSSDHNAASGNASTANSRARAASESDTDAADDDAAASSSSTIASQLSTPTSTAPGDDSASSVGSALNSSTSFCSCSSGCASNSTASCCSSVSSSCPASSLRDLSHGLPVRLSRALSSMSFAWTPYKFDSCELPPPGLCVRGMSEPLAFPLLPEQAEELATLAEECPLGSEQRLEVDSDAGGCLQIEPGMLTFENDEWNAHLDELAAEACFCLGVPNTSVKCELHKMLLCRKGGYFMKHVDIKKTKGGFATLAVQLPSYFKGGQVVFQGYRGEDVVLSGADDGTNRFKCFFSTFYAGVKHEDHPIEEGHRITLLYNLSWTGKGAEPSANLDDLAEVTDALREHVEKSPAGDWYLAFMLEHEYTSRSLSERGIWALEGVDRRSVGALSVAAEMLGIGELDFVLCQLERTDRTQGEDFIIPFELQLISKGYVYISKAYWKDGRNFSAPISWVDWDFVSFTKGKETGPDTVHLDTLRTETEYQAMAVLVWANTMEEELLFKGLWYNVVSFLRDGDPAELDSVRADRMLGCIERWDYASDAMQWTRTKVVLDFCMERGLHEQASRGIKFASTLVTTSDIEVVLFRYVSRYGWDVIGDALDLFLYPSRERALIHSAEALWVSFQLLPWMPVGTALNALAGSLEILECHYGVGMLGCKRFRGYAGCMLDLHHQKNWVMLMSTVGDLELKCVGAEVSPVVDSLVERLTSVMETLTEDELDPIYCALSQSVVEKSSKHLSCLRTVSKRRLVLLRRERFEKTAKLTVAHKTAWPDRYKRLGSDYQREKDWSQLILLCAWAFCGEETPVSTKKAFNKVLETIELLSKQEFDALSNAVSELEGSLEREGVFSLFEEKIRHARAKIDA